MFEQHRPIGGEHENAAELKRVALGATLTKSPLHRPYASLEGLSESHDGRCERSAPSCCVVALSTRIGEQRNRDVELLCEVARHQARAVPDHRNRCASFFDFGPTFRDASNLLAAEHSTVVAKPDQDYGLLRPERAESDRLVLQIEHRGFGEGVVDLHRAEM